MSELKATRRMVLSRVLTLLMHGCKGHGVKDPNGIFVKQERSKKKNEAEQPHFLMKL